MGERYLGFRAAFAELGLEPDERLVRHGLRSRAEAAAAVTGLMALPEPPTALFTSNDLTSMGAIDSGHAGAVALIGFDDFALADKLSPPVSVVDPGPGGHRAAPPPSCCSPASAATRRRRASSSCPPGWSPAAQARSPRTRRGAGS